MKKFKPLSTKEKKILAQQHEITILMNSAKALKESLEETQDALSRSRRMVETLRLNSDSRSLRDMAQDLYDLYYEGKVYKPWGYTEEDVKWHWITLVVQILSGQDLLGRG